MLIFIEFYPNFFRLLCFFFFFALFALLECFVPRRQLTVAKSKRWFNNLSLTFINTLVLRLAFPFTAVSFALLCQQWEIGVFNLWILPYGFTVLLSLLFFDAIIWLQHWAFHAIPLLWRLHSVHHADLNLDLSSAARFHTLEMLLSMFIKFAAIAILGAPVLAVLLFEVILSSFAMFNHANIFLPLWLDKILRVLLVTPDMHRVHHSIYYHENNSNFGFCLSIWDRLFSTYCARSKDGQITMRLGLSSFPDESETVPLRKLLILPFQRQNNFNSTN